MARWVDASVVNAGDGWHEHPTQALLDCYTIRQVLTERGGHPLEGSGVGCFVGLRVAIVGDVRHSRVARSLVLALGALGGRRSPWWRREAFFLLRWSAGPSPRCRTTSMPCFPTSTCATCCGSNPSGVPVPFSLRCASTSAWYGLTSRRAALLGDDALVMHPGPMNRGVEIADDVVALPQSLVLRQVSNGVAVRMAVLFMLLGQGQVGSGGGAPGLAPISGPAPTLGTVVGA